MSNYWNLECRTCHEIHHLEWNNAGEEIQSLIPILPELAAIESTMGKFQRFDWRFNVQFPLDLLRFAGNHLGHDLIAVDEYGDYFDACGEYFPCSCCGRYTHCKLPLKHEGDHSPRAAETAPTGGAR